MTIEYRDVDGFPGYRVGSDGSVWSCKTMGGNISNTWRALRIVVGRDGYAQISLCKKSRTIVRHVHRLVLEAFVGPRPPGMECCHADGNRLNPRLKNLRWDANTNNERDKITHGTSMHHDPRARLSAMLVMAAKQLHARGLSTRRIACQLGCSKTTIWEAVTGRTWKHL